MNLIKEGYKEIKRVASNIIEDVENAIYLYIEQYFINENLDLQSQINYSEPIYKFKLQTILNAILKAVESIGFPNEIIESIRGKYTEFKPIYEYTSYLDWLVNEFQPILSKHITENILSFIASSNQKDLVLHLADYELVSRETIDQLANLRSVYPEFVQFLGWHFDIKEIIQNKIDIISTDFQAIFKLEKVERDLQSIYYLFNLIQYFEIELTVPEVVNTYLREKIEEWAQRNPNVDERYPLLIYIGAKLSKNLNSGIEPNEIKRHLQQYLMTLVNKYKCPLFQETFLTYYIVETCIEMGLKLSPKLIAGLTRYSEADFPDSMLEALSTYQLFLIYETFRILDVENELKNELRLSIKNKITSRMKNHVPYNQLNDLMPTVYSIYGGLRYFESINSLNELSLLECLKATLATLRNAKIGLDLTITSSIADICEGIKVVEWYVDSENADVKRMLSKFLVHIEPEMDDWDNIPAEFQLSEDDLFDTSGVGGSASSSQAGTDHLTLGTADVGIKKFELLPEHFYEFFGKMPIINPDITDIMRINVQGLSNFKDVTVTDLIVLHQWVFIHRILNIQIPIDADTIFQKTSQFRRPNGFTMIGSDYPDPISTFYGLALYNELGLISRLDVNAIQEVLMEDAKNIEYSAIYDNPYIFLSLRILEKYGLAIDFSQFNSILNRVLGFNFMQSHDMVDFFPDVFYHVTLIKSLEPNVEYPMLDQFFDELKANLQEDGSIKNSPSITAMVLCAMHQIGYHASEEGKLMMKYLQLNVDYFDAAVELMPSGLGWSSDFEGFRIEVNILYWSLLALTLMYPKDRPESEAISCPKCGKYFEKKPKFCNGCGHKFE